MQLNRKTTQSPTGLINCTLFNGNTVRCCVTTDEVICQLKDNFAELRVQKTPDEQYYVYQKGLYVPIASDATYIATCTKEIVQLIDISDVDLLLEDLGVITEEESLLMSELS